MPTYTLELGEKADALLTQLAEKKQTLKSEIIRYALASYVYLTENGPDVGLKVSITDHSDRVLKDIILP